VTVTVLFLWGALSDERTGLSFVCAAGSCQRSLSRVRVPWDSWPYFTVSESRLWGEPNINHHVLQFLCLPNRCIAMDYSCLSWKRVLANRWTIPAFSRHVTIRSFSIRRNPCLEPWSPRIRRIRALHLSVTSRNHEIRKSFHIPLLSSVLIYCGGIQDVMYLLRSEVDKKQ
jgi:hypothetical protein